MQIFLKFGLLMVTVLVIQSCSDNFSKSGVRDRSSKTAALTSTVDAAGNYSAQMDSSSSLTQTVRASSGSVAGSALSMPPGALAFPVSVTIGAGGSLTSSSTSAQLGLSDNTATSAGPAVSFIPSTAIQASSPFTLSIPVTSGTGLNLDGTSSDENIVVIYKWITVINGESSYSVGILPRSELVLTGKAVQFQTTRFGTFQVATTKIKITEKIEKQTIVPPVMKSAIFTPLAVTYTLAAAIYRVNTAITSNTVTYTGGAPDEFSVTPALPTGLSISSTTGAITGTGTVISAAAVYTVTAKNEAGSVESKLSIRVASAASPTVSLTSDAANPTSATTFTVTATFSEDVTGFDVSDLTASNATLSSFSGSGSAYSVVVSPTAAGALTVNLAAGAAINDSGTTNSAATQFSRTYALANPSVTLSTSAGAATNGPFTVSATFSETVTGFVIGDITPTNAALTAFSGSGTTYTFLVTPTTNGNVTIDIAANVAQSATSQSNTAATVLTVTYDNIAPTIAFSSVAGGSPGSTLTPTILGTGSETSTVTLYYDAGCVTSKSAGTANTVFASPGIMVNANVGSNTTTTIYGVAIDTAGNASTCTNLVIYTHDSAVPTVTAVTSTKTDGSYKVGEVIGITVTFSESVTVTGTPTLTLETGVTDAVVNYTSGSGGTTLTFNYTVAAGETSADLDYQSTTALALAGGTIKDASLNSATLTLVAPSTSAGATLANGKSIVIDTTAPVITYTSIAPGAVGNSATPQVMLSLSEASSATALGLFSDNGCTSSISTPIAGVSGANTVTTSSLTPNSATTIYAKVTDLAGNVSACTSMASYVHDNVAPSVTNVTSSTTNGAYKVGDVITIQVLFSEPVGVAATPSLLLDSGGSATYSSGSGSPTLTFLYTVAASENSADLDYLNSSSLTGAIADFAMNPATLALPATGSSGSLGFSKALVIDTTAPVISSLSLSGSTPSDSSTQVWAVIFSEPVTGFVPAGVTMSGTNTISVTADSTAPTASWTITVTLPPSADLSGLYPTITSGAALDQAQNQSTSYSGSSATVSYVVPVTISNIGAIIPTKPGLTLRPTIQFTLDRAADAFKIHWDSACQSASIDYVSLAGTAHTLTFAADLPTTGIHSLYGRAIRQTTILSNCVFLGSYTTGINRVMVASETSATVDWACAIANGGLKCWGSNTQGQLGVANPTFSSTPVEIFVPNSSVSGIAMSIDWSSQSPVGASTCVVIDQGVKCWGKNTFGQLGNNTLTSSPTPVTVLEAAGVLTGVASLTGSTGRFCALKLNGELFCWGRNSYGAVGVNIPDTTSNNVPLATRVTGAGTYYSNVSMGDYYTCAVTTTGAVNCWGFDESRKLGGTTAGNMSLPTQVTGIDASAGNIATQVSTDGKTTCAVVSGGARCWGEGNNGQRGDNTVTAAVATPMNVFAVGGVGVLSNLKEVIAGKTGYSIFDSNSAFNSWGSNSFNALFQASNTTSYSGLPLAPIAAPMNSAYTVYGAGYSMAAGSKDVVCIMVNGGVACRGQNTLSNSMGIGSETGYVVPSGSNVTSVSASNNFSCAVIGNSAVHCWGKNTTSIGHLGRGTPASPYYEYIPAAVLSLP